MSGARLKLAAIGHDYGSVRAIDGIELSIEPGTVQVLLGPSGCGKTTLLRVLAGLLVPTRGKVWLDSDDITRVPTDKRGVVLVHQDQLLFPNMSVVANVAYPLRARGIKKREAHRQAEETLDRVQLDNLGGRRPHELSGGQRQRVALARALCARPRVLLLDEPLSALDAGLRDEMRALILGVQRDESLTMVVVTHDQREAASMADKVAVLMEGHLIQNVSPDDLYRSPANADIARFLGATNFLDARFEGPTAHTALGALELPGAAASNGEGTLCIWPHDLAIGDGPNPIEVTVIDTIFTGSERRVTLASPQGVRLEAVFPRWTRVIAGQIMTIHLPPQRLVALPQSNGGPA